MNKPTLKRSLKPWHVVMLGLGYMTPMVVFDTFGIASGETNGHVPLAYVIALAAMLFTAFSYGKMVRAYPSAGSAYTYTQKTISPHLGFLVGWASLLDYIFLPMVNILLIQIYLTAIFPAVPPWIWVVLFVLFVTWVNVKSVKSAADLNTIFVIYQFIVMAAFVVLAVWVLNDKPPVEGSAWVHPFYASDMSISPLIAGATVLCFSFLGFDAVTTYSEETDNPMRTIPLAIFFTALVGGGLFVFTSYFTQLIFPDVSVFNNPDATAPEISLFAGGKLFQLIFLGASFVGALASGLASHASVSRLLYVMGRDSVLPNKLFGYVHPRWRTPVFNVIITGIVSLAAIFFSLETAASFINFGALIAFTFVNLSVIVHYAVRKKEYHTLKDFMSHIAIPLIGAAFVAVLWYHLEANSFMLGLVWVTIGFIYLVYLTRMFKVKPAEIREEADLLESEEGGTDQKSANA
ncbi:APC family permease [Aneurinibacillus aneurinilyticus]|jgi:putrescine importer|uniref:Amino acid permease n=1 Tax=Aneurinibacillus aneurinilyticus ATCC 12856 TaxID=649747 RepID=U1WMP7_ANEAE|nr:APC family permease [Aneurinibacillus aneurinilyticus]ERI03905.1 amino acid permease [Aneurinibacillus aneurinilyticus ATCC 12856]MCI1693093.1 APC family permease [Aneurinibacillus aneurinilyticus]MED0673522.1 APC family permease [Aneurinibacillus aneurinilyticus]MED0705466.1 APC family permease [Aneurinibacillus aneurinilyticus]MED0721892.1 APC family permease [Aneurinibacillus aneurinilyticus]